MKKFRKGLAILLALTFMLSMFAGLPASAEPAGSTSLYDMMTDDLTNPVGIDNAAPVFSWKMQSDVIGQKQTAYQIVVKDGEETVWDSGKVESDKSVGIQYAGEKALEASTEYTWTVTVWDKDSVAVESAPATFETGLMDENAFADANWIRVGYTLSKETNYTIDFDFIIDEYNQGFCFGMQNTGTFVMWQVNTYDGDTVLLRPHFKQNGNWVAYPGGPGNVKAVDLTPAIGYKGSEAIGKKIHERIEVDGASIKTYFGQDADHLTLADTYTYSEAVPLGMIGFRHFSNNEFRPLNEVARYDNFIIKDAEGNVLYENNFENGSETGFTGGTVKDGMLEIASRNNTGELLAIQSENNSNLPAYRKVITPKADLVSAKLYTSGLGVYESYINGERVGRLMDDGSVAYEELKPGFTEARISPRRLYSTYDVTWMMNKGGENVLSAVVTSGWWSDQVAGYVGQDTAYLAKLILTYADGSQEIINTDTTWKSAKRSAVQEGTSILSGERYDARVDQSWMLPGYDDSEWGNAAINTEFSGTISAWSGVPITVRKDLERSAKEISVYQGVVEGSDTGNCYGKVNVIRTYNDGDEITLNPGETLLVDFGQNFAGWEAFEVKGEAGTTVNVERGEMLNDGNGDRGRGCDGPEGSIYNENFRGISANTQYILSGEGVESYHPSFTFYGFQYIEVTTDKPVTFYGFKGQVVTSSQTDTGWMETSDKDVNQLISNIRWGMYSNYLSVPTDCPQRDERQAWTADTQNFAEAGCYLGFSKSFLRKFMMDMRDSQESNGAYQSTAPTGQFWGAGAGQLGWADAGVIVPYTLYVMYGDTSVITENWESMKKFMDVFMASTNKLGGGHSYGDWLAYESNDDNIKDMLGVSYYAWDALLMSEMAKAIGLPDEAERYMAVYEDEKAFFQEQFVNADGTLKRGEQSVCLYALFLDLLPDEGSVEAVTGQLIGNIERNGNRLQTGFLGTEIIMHALTKIDRSDVAYKLLLQHENPSWLYTVDQGATTMWERWNSYTKDKGFGPVGMNSFNHYSYGSVASWMFRSMAGIGYDIENPGFKHIVLAPNPDQSLKTVKASYDSAYGTIVSNSVIDGDTWTYDAVIPANTTATIKLPVEKIDTLTVGGKAPEALTLEADGIVFGGYENGIALFEAVAGSFSFASNVTAYNYVTVKSDAPDHSLAVSQVSVNGGMMQKLPITLKCAEGDVITLTGGMVNDADYGVAGWTDDNGNVLAKGNTLAYTVNSDTVITMNTEWIAPENIALGAAVTGTIWEPNGDWNAAHLTDGVYLSIPGSFGCTTSGSNTDQVSFWFEIDLGKDMDFNRIQLYPRSDTFAVDGKTASFPKDFEIQVRAEGETKYRTVASFEDFESPYQKPAVIEFDSANARYVRLNVTRVGNPPAGEAYYLQLAEMGVYNTQSAFTASVQAPESATANKLFEVTAVTPADVARVALFNEYGLRMGLKELQKADNGDGTVTWTFKMAIGTAGKGRTLTLATMDTEGVYTMTDASFTIDIAAVKPVTMSASIEETATVNEPVTLTVVTNTAASKINIYNEYGLKMGILSQNYQDIDGERVWEVTMAIGTKGVRTFTVSAKNSAGDVSGEVTTNEVVVSRP
ncbi:MAG: family 78 glycoside hydrolase catalytic domain [Clostridiales bacterium]|nr:family 78 glycoside hydrolase catalytic domain [Clostridiales bacterium]